MMYYYKKQIKRKHALIIIFVLSAILLLLPHAMRFAKGNTSMVGYESYYNAWHASQFSENAAFVVDDPLSYESGKKIINPYHVLLSLSSRLMDIGITSKILPFIMGLISTALFYFILVKLKVTENKVFLSSLFFVSSPIFIYIFTVSSHYSMVVLLNLLGLYTFMKNKRYFYASLLTYMIISLFGIYDTIASLSILVIYAVLKKKNRIKRNKKRFNIIVAAMLLISLLQNGILLLQFGLPQQITSVSSTFLQQFITALGAQTGFSIFMLFLVASGVFALWKDKKDYFPIYIFMFALIIISIYLGPFANIYLNFIFSGIAGITIFKLIRRKWHLNIVRDLLLIIILCGIIFSAFSHINLISSAEPDDDLIFSLTWLQGHDDNTDVIQSHPKNGYIIKYAAGMTPFTEQGNGYYYFNYIAGSKERKMTGENIFHSTRLADMTELIEKNNISYIFIDNHMKKGLVWEEEKQEALFLLTNKETFKRVLKNENNEIYKYLG